MSVSLYREHGFPQTNSTSSKNFNSGHKMNLELKPWEASWSKQRWPSICTSSGMTGRATIFSAAARLSWPSAHFASFVVSAATKDSCFLILVSVCLVFPYSFIRPLSQPDRLQRTFRLLDLPPTHSTWFAIVFLVLILPKERVRMSTVSI